ncbi:MAG: hypothetical protein ACRCW4_01485 [Candidatus Neomicrothrix subdominans]
MSSLVRALLSVLAAVVALLGVDGASAAATPSNEGMHTYTYDGHEHAAARTDTVSERGPPAAYDRHTTHDAGDRRSLGASAHPDATTPPATYGYDHSVPRVQDADAAPSTQERHRGSQACPSSRASAGVAAKSADELAHLGQGWRATSFGDEAASFEYHFGKHGVEAGVTREQYAQDALNWARSPAGTGKPIQLKDGTEGLRYRTPGGGPGGITDLDGNIITFWYR